MKVAVVFVTIAPLGTGTPSLSRYVAGVERILQRSGLVHQLTAMGTIVEGDLDAILAVIREMHETPFGQGAVRVSTLDQDRRSTGQGAHHRAQDALGGGEAPRTRTAASGCRDHPTTKTAQERAPWAPMTSDCSMSAVLDGPEMNSP